MRNSTKIFFSNVQSSSSYTPFNNKSLVCPSDTLFIDIADKFAKYYINNNLSNFNNLLPALSALQKSYPNYKTSIIASTVVNLVNCLSSMINVNNDLNNQLAFLENNDLFIIKQIPIAFPKQTITQNTGLKLVYTQYLLMYDIRASNGIFIQSYLDNAQKVLNFSKGVLVNNKKILESFL